jgi:hypothetical protein
MKTRLRANQRMAGNQGCTRVVLQEQIRRRAYALYVEHRRSDGQAVADWLRAEAEILQHEPVEPDQKSAE